MYSKFFLTLKLMRLHSPTGFLLLFFSAAFGQVLASHDRIDPILFVLLFLGSILSRSAGCIINDLMDRNLDAHVERTKDRPLANKSLSVQFALTILCILLFSCLMLLLTLSDTAIYIGLLSVILIVIYPLMKRYTNLAQVFLGITFNGCLVGYASVADNLSLSAVIMYISLGFWTIGYDTIYAFMDLPYDKKIGIKSMAVMLENKTYKAWLLGFYTMFITLFYVACYLTQVKVNVIMFTIAFGLLIWQVATLQINSFDNCLIRFKINNYVGIILLLSMIIGIDN